jgi:membrane-associated protein
VYALLFLIIFVETGVVVMPFLPGDSLLFVVGALCGAGLLSFPVACGVLIVAAVLGDQCNYGIGRYFGPRVFKWENSRLFNKAAFDRAHDFYERYGGITIILARFMPFLRTFAPFVGGVAAMSRVKFTLFNVVGALIWVLGICTAGYFLGSIAWVKTHLDKIIWAMILIPGLIVLLGVWKSRRKPVEV